MVNPTEQMPTLPPTVAGGTLPPSYPPEDEIYPESPLGADPTPWYKRPGPIAVVVIVVLALLGLLAWLLFGGGDDDDSSPESSRLIIELTDDTGQPIDRPISATVEGPAGEESAYEWVRPEDAVAGAPADSTTGTDGRVDFEWEVTDEVADPAAWAATVTVIDTLPLGFTAPGPVVDCLLDRSDGADGTTVEMNVAPSGDNTDADGFVVYTFPGYRFVMGDTVTCELVFAAPGPVESTVVDTTVVDTTVADTTTTTSTTTTTVAPTTTIPVVTVPPQPAATMWDVIANNPDLSGIRDWITQAGLEADFQDSDVTMTLLAPSNQAIENAATTYPGIDFTDPATLLLLVNTHLDETQALLISDITDLATIDVVEPGPHDVDASVSPPLVCQLDCASTPQASFLVTDVETANGVIQVIDTVLLPVALIP